MSLTVTGFSTALFATWYFVDDLSLLLDCGDGASAGLLQKSRKVRTIAISHADRDHLNGLPQFLELNARERGLPVVLHPRDSSSILQMKAFCGEFGNRSPEGAGGNRWEPMAEGGAWNLGKANARIEGIPNRHIEETEGQVRSLSYRVVRDHHRLRPEWVGRDETDIARARKDLGDDAVMFTDQETLLAYSADTPIERPDFWGRPRLLIHEATFLHVGDAEARGQQLRHSALDQVIPMAVDLPLEALILGHFSTRYSEAEIRGAIRRECARHRPAFPVHAVMPGEIRRDILRDRPVWEP